MTTPAAELAPVPIVDLSEGGPVRRAAEAIVRARGLRDACVNWLPRPAAALLPALDSATRRWLKRSCSPYTEDVEAIAATLGFPGIWFLNGCYQWGCTSLACDQGGVPWLARTLDWPFPGLGRYIEVARMRGPAGDFDNITWPGYVGTLTASAPGRFAASLNQAPMRRRTRRPWLRPYDMILNARRTWRIRSIPPDHLLRQVFETCRNYAEAKHRLERTPVARPAIYTLVGCTAAGPGKRACARRCCSPAATRRRRRTAVPGVRRSRPGMGNSRAAPLAGWWRPFSIRRRASRSSFARRRVCCARSATSRLRDTSCRSPRPRCVSLAEPQHSLFRSGKLVPPI